MNTLPKVLAIAISAILLMSTGCDALSSLFGKKYGKLTKAEMRRIIKEEQELLPLEIDEYATLRTVSVDFSGNVTATIVVDSEVAAIYRAVGTVAVKEACKEAVEGMDVSGSPCLTDGLKHLILQEGVSVHYVIEDKFGSVLASVMLSEESVKGKETVGETQRNPFAVRNVSAKGDK